MSAAACALWSSASRTGPVHDSAKASIPVAAAVSGGSPSGCAAASALAAQSRIASYSVRYRALMARSIISDAPSGVSRAGRSARAARSRAWASS